MPPASTDVLRGTLDLLILQVAAASPEHGWGLAQRIEEKSRDAFKIGQGSLYPALQRLEQKGWIDSDWRTTEGNRRARYYRLTASGRRALAAEVASWRQYVAAVDLILAPA
jgi:transcriptional regulator